MISNNKEILAVLKKNPAAIAGVIDHTLLKPEATPSQIEKLCSDALEFGFASVCVNPVYVPLSVSLLSGSNIPVCTVVGFPLGANSSQTKEFEARQALDQGAREIDMVQQIGLLKAGKYQEVREDIERVVRVCREHQVLCKVILETALLTDDEIVVACRLSREAGADFVKTSTGFGPGGATVHAVSLMSQEVASFAMGVKAAGGIKTYQGALEMIEAGATRIGASAGVQIVHQARNTDN